MKLRAFVVVASTVAAGVVVVGVQGCLTAYNRYKLTPVEGAPKLEERPGGCNVDVFEDGTKVPRKRQVIGHIVLEWPQDKIKEQGPEGAIKTLKAAACENGAFIVEGMRALPTGDGGMVYEADLATLVGDDGKPLNPKLDKSVKPPPAAGAPDAAKTAAAGEGGKAK